MCDDENVEPIDESDIYRYFGDYPSGAGYVLFYQAADLDLSALGLTATSVTGSTGVSAPQSTTAKPDLPSHVTTTQAPTNPPAAHITPVTPPTPLTPVAFIQPRRANSAVSPIAPPPVVAPALRTTQRESEPPAPVQHSPVQLASMQPPTALAMTPPIAPPTPAAAPAPTPPLATPTTRAPAPTAQADPRGRTVSSSSQTSSDKYSGGGGLSRRLSGISVSKIGRSGSMSFGKLGFGKKDKNITE